MTFHPKKPGAGVEQLRQHLGIVATRRVVPIPDMMDALSRNLLPNGDRDEHRSVAQWLKRGMIAAWALWLSVVTLSNVLDALKALGALGPGWRFVSGNYALVEKAMELYTLPAWLIALTFLAVICWEGSAAALLWRAAARFRGTAPSGLGPMYVAFGALIGLWFAFMVMDELFLQYVPEGAHRQLLIGSLATLLAVALLPE